MPLENQNATNTSNAATTSVITNGTLSIPQLQAAVQGRVLTPEDEGYDKARTTFYNTADRRPAVIVQVANADDVAHVVNVARKTGMELAIRSGGHSSAGHSVTNGGIMLDLSQMKGLEIDVENRTAWAETGLTAGEYTNAVGEHGLATGFGDSESVGIGGITLGGGIGFLVRKYGLTIDDVLAAEIVTADGQIRYVDANTEPDLFWAIRGGGGNFGVVTRFKYRLHEVPSIVGGLLMVPATPEIVRAFVAEAEAAPEELSVIGGVMVAPPMPMIPSEYHGKLVVMALMVYAGDTEAGERAVGRFSSLATPFVDTLRPMKYPEMYEPEPEDYHPMAAARTFFIDAIQENETDIIFDYLQKSTAQAAMAQFRVLGGAVARVPNGATAFAHRDRKIMMVVAAIYGDPEEAPEHQAWASAFAKELGQGTTGAYVNFLSDEGAERVREAYPGATWDRLSAVKARYDPTNLFRLNQNITPASNGSSA